jgi:hypothetical protein
MRVAGNRRRSAPRAARAGIQAGFPPRRCDVPSGNDEPRHTGYGFPDHSPAGFATHSEHAAHRRRRARQSLQLMNFRHSTERDRFIGIIFLAGVVCLMTIAIGCRGFSGSSLSFILKFPQTVDLGELWLIEDVNCFTCGTGEKYLGRASGNYDISLPAAHWFVSLRMPKNASALLPHLGGDPSLSNLGDINLESSDVKDDDLRYLASINLRSINLSKTRIRGEGLRYLSPKKKWSFVELRDGCFFAAQTSNFSLLFVIGTSSSGLPKRCQ